MRESARGSKPVMNYVTAIMTSFNNNSGDVVIKARGRSISTGVDAVEGTRQRFMKDLKPCVNIGTEQMDGEEGRTRNVSTIQITLRKGLWEAMRP